MKIRTIHTVKYEIIWDNGETTEHDNLNSVICKLQEQGSHVQRCLEQTETYIQQLKDKKLEIAQKIAHVKEYAKQEKAG